MLCNSRISVATLVAAFSILSASSALAGDPAADNAPLSGPKVSEREQAADSILKRDAMGMIVRLERDPALEALDRLKLDDATRAAADQVVTKRLSVLDRIVQDNFILIAELSQAGQAGDKTARNRLLRETYEKAKPYFARGSLADELKPVLSETDHASLKRMVEEYRDACITERMKGVNDEGKKPSTFEASMAEQFTVLGIEVRRSYARTVEQGGRDFDALLKRLQLSPEQESKIRKRAEDAFLGSKGKPSPLQIIRLVLESYQELDDAQRKEFAKIIAENRKSESGGVSRRASKPSSANMETPAKPGQYSDMK